MKLPFIHKNLSLHPAQLALLVGDTLTLQLVLIVTVLTRALFGDVTLSVYFYMSFILLFGPVISAMLGACEIPAPPAHRELKQIFTAVSFTYLMVFVFLFMTQSSVAYSRYILVTAWFFSIILVPMQRGFVRRRLCHKPWWSRAVIFLQSKAECQCTWDEIMDNPVRGLRPMMCLNIHINDHLWSDKILEAQKKYYKPLFIWCSAGNKEPDHIAFFEEVVHLCRHILIVPPKDERVRKFWYAPRVLGTSSAFLVRQNLSDLRRLRIKRLFDIFFSALAAIALSPLAAYIALSIRKQQKKNGEECQVLYTQERIGQGGEKILVYKFRSMVANADSVLEKYLADNEELQQEWEETQKLKNDPRITPIGKWIRKTSLDELPQLINVFMGNMSLVGPRPIVESEIERYGDVYLDYTEVKPGITGLWQISGRNHTSYQQRVWFDRYYVTNWSVWMDIWILARTIPVVIRCEGAY